MKNIVVTFRIKKEVRINIDTNEIYLNIFLFIIIIIKLKLKERQIDYFVITFGFLGKE